MNKLFSNNLTKAVREAWNAVTSKQLNELIDSMRARFFQAVIDADVAHSPRTASQGSERIFYEPFKVS